MATTTDKIALVTGSGQGIGAAIAHRLARAGMHVCINDLDAARANETAAAIMGSGGTASTAVGDISDPETIDGLFASIERDHGMVTTLVNNAGIGGNAAIRDVTPDYWHKVRSVDLDAVLYCSRRFLAPLRDAKTVGSIVNIASRAWLGWWGQSAYATSKAGVVGMTRALAVEFSSRLIRVNVVAPGLIDTTMLRNRSEEALERLIQSVPTATLGTPGDIASAVEFLASDRARAITGQVLYICGGKSVYAYPEFKN